MFSDLVRHSNTLGFPTGALFFFFTCFLLLCVVLLRSGKAAFDADANLPLDDGNVVTTGRAPSAGEKSV